MKPAAHGLTDVGRRRDKNEDAYLVEPSMGLYAVADGMGGHAAGEIASRLAMDALSDSMRRGGWNPDSDDTDEATRRLESAVLEANRRICDSIQFHDEQRGMGTTLVALLTAGGRAVLAHVGDSRAYLLRGGALVRLTSDHSWVNEQVKLGLLSDDDAQRHPMRNIVTRALGSRPDVAMDRGVEDMHTGDVFLLCSDGLNTMLSDDEIRDLMDRHRGQPESACQALVAAANQRGGEDNVTVVVVVVP
ncbi:MAG: Stp1/IreP family PP2C-type Ser/Thr phosphatase [Acidobacteriia bacterium]|nr:Stp1/IreP family PP2C-type Ser/Thr phosphatase [Terriglobia bacterium]